MAPPEDERPSGEEGEEEEDGEEKPKQVAPPKVRELPDVDIFESPNFGNEDVDANVLQLQMTLKEKLKDRKDMDGKYIAYNDLGMLCIQ